MNLRSIVAIVNRKGGSGKSTTTFQLAGAILDRVPRVLIVDLDPQASLTRLLLEEPVEEGYGIGSCIVLDGRPAADILCTTAIGVDLLPGDRSIEIAAEKLRSYPAGFRRLRRVLQTLPDYDAVLLDTPPSLEFATAIALVAAQWAVLPTMTVQQDIDALQDTLRLIDSLVEDEERVATPLAIVPTDIDADNVDRGVVALLRETFGDLIASPVPHSVAMKRSMNARMPIVRYEPRATATIPYRELAERVLQATASGQREEATHGAR
jgi:chromosome partitioning protein